MIHPSNTKGPGVVALVVPIRPLVSHPGGTLIVLAWLLAQEIQLDKDLSAYYHASFGEFMERKRKQEEAKHDIHSVSDQ